MRSAKGGEPVGSTAKARVPLNATRSGSNEISPASNRGSSATANFSDTTASSIIMRNSAKDVSRSCPLRKMQSVEWHRISMSGHAMQISSAKPIRTWNALAPLCIIPRQMLVVFARASQARPRSSRGFKGFVWQLGTGRARLFAPQAMQNECGLSRLLDIAGNVGRRFEGL